MMPETATNGAARWIFHLQVNNRPGVLSAVTAIFADRGFSIQTLTAHDSGDTGTAFGAVLLTFTAPSVKKDYLARILSRSAMVQHVTIYRYEDSAHARKSISVRVAMSADALRHALPETILCDVISSSPSETLAVLLGPPVLVDQALSALSPSAMLESTEPTIMVV